MAGKKPKPPAKKKAPPAAAAPSAAGPGDALLEGLPGDLRLIAEAAGLEAALRIAGALGGTTIYVPDVLKSFRDEAIRRDFDRGASARQLAIRHRVSERWIWKILKRPSKELPPAVERLVEEFISKP